MLEGQLYLGLVVEAVEDDAIGKTVRRLVLRRQVPDDFGRQSALADAAGTGQGDDPAGLQAMQQLG